MHRRFFGILGLTLAWLAIFSSLVFAQGGTGASLSGTIVDSSGAVIPGADVLVKNTATNAEFRAVSGAQGTFSVPALPPGSYRVTVSLMGFKTAILNDVALNAGVPGSVRAVLEVGALSEAVVVEAGSSIVQTQSSSVSTTLNVTQISNLPLVSRSVLDFVVNLPGVSTPGGNRNSIVNGLPQSAINITLDGINVQDNTLKTTDGFFSIVSPRLDAIEEVTVSTAAQGAESAGQGAIQIRFVTRSGSNLFTGSAYHYYRNDRLNANTWFNERDGVNKPELLQNQFGARTGGPILKNRLFYFVNYEEFRQPQTITRNRTILSPAAQAGVFQYNTSSGVRSVDLLALARANGHLPTPDPIVTKLLSDIRSSTTTTGAITQLEDPNLQRYTWNVDQRSLNRYPTVRLDWNASMRHRVTGSLNYQTFLSTPDTLNNRDPVFPGFPATATQTSTRANFSSSLRSTLTGTMVNELRVGGSGAPVQFFKELSPSMWGGAPVADQGGFRLDISTANISNPSNAPTPSSRNASTFLVENTLNWLKGPHTFNLGGSFTRVNVWIKNQTLVPEIDFDVLPGDPAEDLFTTAYFPGSSTTNRNDAGDLYAVLLGRVSAVTGEARINEQGTYEYLGPSMQRGRLQDFAFWVQDSWRPRSDLTLNFGLRWELQSPFYPLNDSYSNATLQDVWGVSGLSATCTNPSAVTPDTCNLFKPGQLGGKSPVYVPFEKGENAYNVDWNNLAPSIGAAWTPSADSGIFRRLLGGPGDTVVRAGFARAFNRPGMSDFTGRYDDNPGIATTVNRTQGLGNLGPLPLLLRQPARLAPPPFSETREYPMTDVVTGDVATFDPNIRVPYGDSWTAGIQRGISRNMAIEARYVGSRSRDLWNTYDYNEINLVENGFLNEFRAAQRNLQANLAAGRGANFRYYGPGTGTTPLPVLLAYFSGFPASMAGDPARYSSSNFASSTFVNPLATFSPQPFAMANELDNSSSRRDNAIQAGLPVNFFVANPDRLGGAEVAGNGGFTNFHSLQLELRRRMADGFQFQSSYAFGRVYNGDFFSFRRPWMTSRDTGSEGEVTHAFKANWVYELPFGRGRRFGGGAGSWLDRLIGGWQFHGTTRIQSGQLVDFGNVRLVGFEAGDLRKMFKMRTDGRRHVWMLPQDVIDNTVRAFSVSATSPTGYGALGPPQGRYFAPPNGPDCIEIAQADLTDQLTGFGDCGARTVVARGPLFKLVDLSVAKLVPITRSLRAEFRFEVLNAFNWANFVPVTGIGADPTDYEVTNLTGGTDSRVVQIVSRISW